MRLFRTSSVVLTIALCLTLFPQASSADESDSPGTCTLGAVPSSTTVSPTRVWFTSDAESTTHHLFVNDGLFDGTNYVGPIKEVAVCNATTQEMNDLVADGTPSYYDYGAAMYPGHTYSIGEALVTTTMVDGFESIPMSFPAFTVEQLIWAATENSVSVTGPPTSTSSTPTSGGSAASASAGSGSVPFDPYNFQTPTTTSPTGTVIPTIHVDTSLKIVIKFGWVMGPGCKTALLTGSIGGLIPVGTPPTGTGLLAGTVPSTTGGWTKSSGGGCNILST